MPIGIPKVPFRIPGEEESIWVDVNRLHRERLLFLGQEVDSEISNQLVGLMIYLSIEDKTKNFYLFINSPGGWVVPGVAIYDTMQFVSPDIHTICMGLAASMGSFLLVAGTITKRLAFPHARVMIHQPASSFYEAQAGEFILEAEELLKLREILTKVYVQRTGKPLWVISEDMERDVFMSATEAQAHGIIDLVAVKNKNTIRDYYI
uniref:ATP-dependent Clp protease proteolytic subunit n=1 Tax=Changnienia amoena TaxID=591961 RepID=A0A650AM22_9ASPA|nr:clpP-like protease [Changnienia amoena]QGN74460.1 clpP-like protease [Changnienia amoena]QKV47552.1 clp protease proteolytic subunit [Changnienia amoena]